MTTIVHIKRKNKQTKTQTKTKRNKNRERGEEAVADTGNIFKSLVNGLEIR